MNPEPSRDPATLVARLQKGEQFWKPIHTILTCLLLIIPSLLTVFGFLSDIYHFFWSLVAACVIASLIAVYSLVARRSTKYILGSEDITVPRFPRSIVAGSFITAALLLV